MPLSADGAIPARVRTILRIGALVLRLDGRTTFAAGRIGRREAVPAGVSLARWRRFGNLREEAAIGAPRSA